MASFSVIGGALSVLSDAEDEMAAVQLMAEKDPRDLVALAVTTVQLQRNISPVLFPTFARAIFHGRTPQQLRQSLSVTDDLPAPGQAWPKEANAGNAALRDLLETLDPSAVLPLLTWGELDVCAQVCQRCRRWATPEMEQRADTVVAQDRAGELDDDSFSVGAGGALQEAAHRLQEWHHSGASKLDLHGIQMPHACWTAVWRAIKGGAHPCCCEPHHYWSHGAVWLRLAPGDDDPSRCAALLELDLSDCRIPIDCSQQLVDVFCHATSLLRVGTALAGDDDGIS
jgi:hypothetical protein